MCAKDSLTRYVNGTARNTMGITYLPRNVMVFYYGIILFMQVLVVGYENTTMLVPFY